MKRMDDSPQLIEKKLLGDSRLQLLDPTSPTGVSLGQF